MSNFYLAIDFDGTCVSDAYPDVGRDIGAAPYLKQAADAGASILLWTCRSGKPLREAVQWFADNDIPLYGCNHNPEQYNWNYPDEPSPKAFAHIYVDDRAFGVPLVMGSSHVDWSIVGPELVRRVQAVRALNGR